MRLLPIMTTRLCSYTFVLALPDSVTERREARRELRHSHQRNPSSLELKNDTHPFGRNAYSTQQTIIPSLPLLFKRPPRSSLVSVRTDPFEKFHEQIEPRPGDPTVLRFFEGRTSQSLSVSASAMPSPYK